MTDPSSLVRRAWWAVGWFGIGLVIYLSVMHDPPTIDVPQGDKLGHAAAYATLMLWFAQLDAGLGYRRGTALGLVALGVALEFVQRAIGYRDFSYGDMLADAIGVALGWRLAPPRLPNLLALAQRITARFVAAPP